MKKQKEKIEVKEQEEMPENGLQDFMNDMKDLGTATQDRNLIKPSSFNYGDLTVTNYLLWLLLAEAMKLNDKLGGE